MNILFVDIKTSENYDFKYMESNPLGGTESTVLRLARELAKKHNVYLSQLNRTERYVENNVTFIHRSESLSQDFIPDIIIIIRKYKLLKEYSLAFPKAKMFVWVHNFSKHEILGRRHWMVKTNAKVVCVSENHRQHIDNILNGTLSWLFRLLAFKFNKVPVSYVYNTIEAEFSDKKNNYDPNKLFFFSSPNKGLKETLMHFSNLLKVAPNYKLYITTDEEAYREYKLDRDLLASGAVVLLGRIAKDEIIKHTQESFCVFYPQHVHAETFGLVYVEANCAGTPVLAHDFGAASEVMKNKQQLVNGESSEEVVNKMLDWAKNGRPEVSCDERFSISYAIKKWNKLLNLN